MSLPWFDTAAPPQITSWDYTQRGRLLLHPGCLPHGHQCSSCRDHQTQTVWCHPLVLQQHLWKRMEVKYWLHYRKKNVYEIKDVWERISFVPSNNHPKNLYILQNEQNWNHDMKNECKSYVLTDAYKKLWTFETERHRIINHQFF